MVLILQIAIGIVLATIILAFLPQILGAGAVLLVAAVGLAAIVYGVTFAIEETEQLVVLLSIIGGGAGSVLGIALLGCIGERIPVLSRYDAAGRKSFKDYKESSQIQRVFEFLLDRFKLGLIVVLLLSIGLLITTKTVA
jgi:hypothetical protein